MKKIFAISIAATLILSCTKPLAKREEIIKAVDRFLSFAKNGNDQAIYDMCYHVDYANQITDDGLRKNLVNFYQRVIGKFGIPPYEKWIFRKSAYAYEVHIPIDNYDGSEPAYKTIELVLYYCPPQIANKIFNAQFTGETRGIELKPPVIQKK